MKPRKVNKIVEEVTKNIIKRSKSNRLKYLQKLNAAKDLNIRRDLLSCGNIAHSVAGCSSSEKKEIISGEKPNIAIVELIKINCKGFRGVRKPIKYPINVVERTPPIKPSHVLFGLTFGKILCFPNIFPQTNCIMSFASVIKIKNNNKALPETPFEFISGKFISNAK